MFNRRKWFAGLLAVLVGVSLSGCAIFGGDDDKDTPKNPYKLLTVTKSDQVPYITFTYQGIESWPEEFSKTKKKYMKGCIVVNNNCVEHFWKDMTRQHLNNIYGGAPYGVKGIKTGQTVKIKLRSNDGKYETNEVDFTWPWKGT